MNHKFPDFMSRSGDSRGSLAKKNWSLFNPTVSFDDLTTLPCPFQPHALQKLHSVFTTIL